jgi:kynureninase
MAYQADEAFAISQDESDPIRHCRELFYIPTMPSGEARLYFCGNSLGLQPKTVRAMVEQELNDWRDLAVDAHFDGQTPWYSYHEVFADVGSRLVGAKAGAGEVVMMNSLTVNLHLLMVSFFQPQGKRTKILMEAPAFPSDTYAIKTHLRTRGLDPAEHLLVAQPQAGSHTIAMTDLEAMLHEHGEEIALVLIGGVNFFTGQVFDMARITELGRTHGCIVGFDLAHAAGNVPMKLHEWGVDFAAWCSYKYLNAGPGAVAGVFIHEKHAKQTELVRYGGWWGNDPSTRFRMHLEPEFLAKPTAEGWQLSNPPILAMAPLRASLDIFDDIGMDTLRAKSIKLTGYLRWLLEQQPSDRFEIITPAETDAQGCQLSILLHDQPKARFKALESAGIVGDFREPNVIRIAPTPLYNTYHEVWQFAQTLTGRCT